MTINRSIESFLSIRSSSLQSCHGVWLRLSRLGWLPFHFQSIFKPLIKAAILSAVAGYPSVVCVVKNEPTVNEYDQSNPKPKYVLNVEVNSWNRRARRPVTTEDSVTKVVNIEVIYGLQSMNVVQMNLSGNVSVPRLFAFFGFWQTVAGTRGRVFFCVSIVFFQPCCIGHNDTSGARRGSVNKTNCAHSRHFLRARAHSTSLSQSLAPQQQQQQQ